MVERRKKAQKEQDLLLQESSRAICLQQSQALAARASTKDTDALQLLRNLVSLHRYL